MEEQAIVKQLVMDASTFYYQNQATARGLNNLADCKTVRRRNDRIYDTLLLPQLPKEHDAQIFEVACGPGLVLSWLRDRGYVNASGSDICESYINLAKEWQCNARLQDSLQALAEAGDASLDAVLAIDFVEHLPREVFLELLRQSNRVLRPGGRLILRMPNADSPLVGRNLFNDITHVWTYTSVAIGAIGRVMGFSRFKFLDEATADPSVKSRLLQPFAWLARKFLYIVFALATRERIKCWSPNLFVIMIK